MWAVAHHAALAIAVLALTGAGLRVATWTGASGLLRVVAAAPLVGAAAALEALVLGFAGLGARPAALVAAALATWLLARRLPAPRPPVRVELMGWWAAQAPLSRALWGVLVGLAVAGGVWGIRHPELGSDGIAFRLPQVITWVQTGQPGSLHEVFRPIPVEFYPVTHEVLLSWLVGISRGFVVVTVFEVALCLLLGAAVIAGLRAMAVSWRVAVLAAAAITTMTQLLTQLYGPYTDLPALAWLACAGALSAAASRRPALLVPGVLAASLAVGTKTTTAAAAALAIAGGAVTVGRHRLRSVRAPLVGAVVAGAVVGGFWYMRDLVIHGSPFWPLVSAPWGDPVPAFLRRFDGRFIADPVNTLSGHLGTYRAALGGSILLLVGGLVAPLLVPRRAVVLVGLAAVLLSVLWAVSPYTAPSKEQALAPLAVSTTRYLLPALLTGGLALGLAAAAGGRGARIAAGLLVAAVAWNVLELASKPFPYVPTLASVLVGAVAGAAVAVLTRAPLLAVGHSPLVAPVIFVGVLAVLGLPASGWVRRHAELGGSEGQMTRFLTGMPGYAGDSRPVEHLSIVIAPLAGDLVRHPLGLLPSLSSCTALTGRARRAWVVLSYLGIASIDAPARLADGCLSRVAHPVYANGSFRVYAPSG